MISDVKLFVENFSNVELDARNASLRPDIDFFNRQLDIMNSFCIEELYDAFGMVKLDEPETAVFYESNKKFSYSNKRLLFKISQYSNNKYGELYLVYVSGFSSIYQSNIIFDCLFIARINNEYKIVRRFWFSEEDGIEKIWKEGHGDEDISFETVGELVVIERYLEPIDDEYSMEDYKKEK